jgi:hypothetical protein
MAHVLPLTQQCLFADDTIGIIEPRKLPWEMEETAGWTL